VLAVRWFKNLAAFTPAHESQKDLIVRIRLVLD